MRGSLPNFSFFAIKDKNRFLYRLEPNRSSIASYWRRPRFGWSSAKGMGSLVLGIDLLYRVSCTSGVLIQTREREGERERTMWVQWLPNRRFPAQRQATAFDQQEGAAWGRPKSIESTVIVGFSSSIIKSLRCRRVLLDGTDISIDELLSRLFHPVTVRFFACLLRYLCNPWIKFKISQSLN